VRDDIEGPYVSMDYENIQRMIRDGELDGSAHFIEPDHSDCCPRCGWINVDDRLPETEVIAFGRNYEMIIGYISNDNGFYCAENEGEQLINVTHWQPLPDPPEKQPESE